MESKQIYKVTTEGDIEGRTTRILGYCTGDKIDIAKFFDSLKYYSLQIEPLQVQEITPDSANHKAHLIAEKKNLTDRLKEIEKQL